MYNVIGGAVIHNNIISLSIGKVPPLHRWDFIFFEVFMHFKLTITFKDDHHLVRVVTSFACNSAFLTYNESFDDDILEFTDIPIDDIKNFTVIPLPTF